MSTPDWTWALPAILIAAGVLILARRRKLRGRRLYRQHLERALADGILSEREAEELEGLRAQRDLSDTEVRMVAVSLYRRALRDAIADSRITRQEDEALQRLRAQLGLTDTDLARDLGQLQRIRLLAGVERGELPQIEPPVELNDDEICHWTIHARLAEQLVVPGRGTALRAVSFSLENSDPFSVTAARSVLADSSEVLPSDLGMLVVTNRRTIFSGARRNVSIPHMKLRTLDLFADGVALDETDPAHTSFFLVSDPELTAAVLLSAARKRQRELKNLTTRTA